MRFRDVGEVINRHASMSGLSVVMCKFGQCIYIPVHISSRLQFFLRCALLSFVTIGEIILWPWYWRVVPLCPKYSPLWKYPC